MKMDLVRDVLDKQLVIRDKRPKRDKRAKRDERDKGGEGDEHRIGKVDGLVLEIAPGKRPRVAAIEVGAVVLARRLHPRLARWTAALLRRLGAPSEPFRIPWSRVRDVGMDVEVDLELGETRLHAWQQWLRQKVMGRIPGG